MTTAGTEKITCIQPGPRPLVWWCPCPVWWWSRATLSTMSSPSRAPSCRSVTLLNCDQLNPWQHRPIIFRLILLENSPHFLLEDNSSCLTMNPITPSLDVFPFVFRTSDKDLTLTWPWEERRALPWIWSRWDHDGVVTVTCLPLTFLYFRTWRTASLRTSRECRTLLSLRPCTCQSQGWGYLGRAQSMRWETWGGTTPSTCEAPSATQ